MSNTQQAPIFSVRDLKVHFPLRKRDAAGNRMVVHAVDGVSFDIPKGRALAIVGESGSGKTTTALSVMRLTPVTAGNITFKGVDITHLEGRQLRDMRRSWQLIFQDPYSSLNPRQRAGDIIRTPMRLMHIGDRQSRRERVDELMKLVGLRPDQKELFPHQFSGGQRQRLSIARALASDPDLLVCDEPVSALDVAIQAQILNLLRRIQMESERSFLFISHDMAVVQHVCDDVAVMYLGQFVEMASRVDFFTRPLHPYSVALLSAVPTVRGGRDKAANRIRLQGDPPSPIEPPKGCRFAGRCPAAQDLCRAEAPELREVKPGHKVACHFVETKGGEITVPLEYQP